MRQRHWNKILYEEQGVPDNYVDDSFLEELRKNLYIRTYNFLPVVIESGVVTQQLSSVCLFVAIFFYMDEGRLSPDLLLLTSSAFTLICYVTLIYLSQTGVNASSRTYWDDLRTCVLFVASGYFLSPLLMTMTETISTDTLYLMVFFILLANLLFHDYGTSANKVSQPLSLNAAIFASVCLASRLHTVLHTFTTVTFAVQIFALWPLLRTSIKNTSRIAFITLTVLLVLVTAVLVWTVSTVASVIYVLLTFFITFICPAWLIHLQPYKNNIYGPWDEAVIQED